jgi:uncharacterized protein with HEPN domain
MSPERNWKMRVEDILSCIEKVKGYTREMSYELSLKGPTR